MKSENPVSSVPVVPSRVLLGPGPSEANSRVLDVMSGPMIGYLDPDFMKILDEISTLLNSVFQTDSSLTMAISGTGSAGMEAGINSLLEPDDTVLICVCGFFGRRMVDMAERVGANVVVLESDWGKPFPPELLEDALSKHRDVKMVTVVHGETSTGILQPLSEMSLLTKQNDALFMVDAVTSLGGSHVNVDKLDIDYCYSATQKCLGCPPGLSPVAISEKAQEALSARKNKPTSWYLDLELICNYWKQHVYHHTAPVSNMVGLREGLSVILEEGLDTRIARHQLNATALRAGLSALGLRLVVPDEFRLNQITPVWVPEGIDDDEIRVNLLRNYNIEIGKGLGEFAGKVWRIGLMGESSKAEYVLRLLSAMEEILYGKGVEFDIGSGVTAANEQLDKN